jgi:hypothetical protein
VLPNLKLHAQGWPEADFLHSIVYEGQGATASPTWGRASPVPARKPSSGRCSGTTRARSGW